MISLNKMSNNLTNIITKDLDYNEDKKEIIAYSIETSLLAVIGTLLLILFAFIANALKPALIAALFGVALRKVSGGAHFNTPTKCLIFGAIVYTLLGFLAQTLIKYQLNYDYLLWISLASSFLIVIILAPVDSDSKPIHSKRLRNNLKMLSIVLIIVALIIYKVSSEPLLIVSMCLGVLYQSLTLLPVFNRRGGG
ncbi:Accessory gene regulator B [Desulfitobacterium hafniense DCB-2]|uniref:Accessory gene regulator B n=3 Tax=root TaxID=1 RepID=B8FY91_DESHD|nr:accessory gene regulator B family protein [Desulfitobacterium hafniense]ACL18978.1 Accessory gene regulator B [Desulfitobacterium hafniense DCB-2]MEA5025078.1 accessory gene regulator B family protein [Desulfitobacterium hafniense]